MDERNALFYFIVLMLFISLIVSPSAPKASDIKDTLIIQIADEIVQIDNRYRLSTSALDSMVGKQWQGYLLRNSPGETVKYFPAAVESLTQSGNVSDPKFTFTLREGLTFHDGSALTARDVKYSFAANRAVYYGLGVLSTPSYSNISQALTMTMNYFNITFPTSDPNGDGLEFSIGPGGTWFPQQEFLFNDLTTRSDFMLVPEGSHGSYTDDQATCEAKIASFQLNPISCGPYKFVENIAGDYILLERFDDWFGWGDTFTDNYGNPITFPVLDSTLKYIKFRVIPESAMAAVELKTGGVDATTSKFDSREALEEINATAEFEGFTVESLRTGALQLNAEGNWPTAYGGPGNFPQQEIWFRKALAHAVNRTNMVENVYDGLAVERKVFYPEWILDKYPGIDTSDYYVFTSDPEKAIQLLEDNEYPKLGFVNDPDNRFGYGPYLNETSILGVEQTNGYRFKMIVDASEEYKVERGIAVAKDLEQVGIMVDTIFLDRTAYLEALQENFDPGYAYNTSYIALGEPDPDFNGPDWDFAVSGPGYWYESPIQYVIYASYIYWYYYGGDTAIYNEQFEIELAKMYGGRGYLDFLPYSVAGDFTFPEWSAFDTQFVEAAEEAGRIFTNELLTYIPFTWDLDSYAINSRLKNFLPSRNGDLFLAFTWWSAETTTTTTTTTDTSTTITTTTTTTTTTTKTTTTTTTGTSEPRITTGWSLLILLSSVMVSLIIFRKRR